MNGKNIENILQHKSLKYIGRKISNKRIPTDVALIKYEKNIDILDYHSFIFSDCISTPIHMWIYTYKNTTFCLIRFIYKFILDNLTVKQFDYQGCNPVWYIMSNNVLEDVKNAFSPLIMATFIDSYMYFKTLTIAKSSMDLNIKIVESLAELVQTPEDAQMVIEMKKEVINIHKLLIESP